jgi:hypothetical protein
MVVVIGKEACVTSDITHAIVALARVSNLLKNDSLMAVDLHKNYSHT